MCRRYSLGSLFLLTGFGIDVCFIFNVKKFGVDGSASDFARWIVVNTHFRFLVQFDLYGRCCSVLVRWFYADFSVLQGHYLYV